MSERIDINPEGDAVSGLIKEKTQNALDLIAARLPEGITCSAEVDPAIPELTLVFTGKNPLAGETARVNITFKMPSMDIGKICAGVFTDNILKRGELQKVAGMHEIGGIVIDAFSEKGLIEKPMPINPEGVLYQMERAEAQAIISRFGNTIEQIRRTLPTNITLRGIAVNAKTNSLLLEFQHRSLGILGRIQIDGLTDDIFPQEEKPLFNDDYGEEVLFKDDGENNDDDDMPLLEGKKCLRILNFYFNRDDGRMKERRILMMELDDVVMSAFEATFDPKYRLLRGGKPEIPRRVAGARNAI
ncbi:MAG: hypothetical protein LBE65_03430, partial [Synergistaceae bacterium]|nr:hypothetical protein [Synergistaceae bacterium]